MKNVDYGSLGQLIFFGVVVLFSILSSLLQQKKKSHRDSSTRGHQSAGQPVPAMPHFPRTTTHWQDELKRLLEGTARTNTPPVITKPTVSVSPVDPQRPADRTTYAQDAIRRLHSRLKPSGSAYARASQLNERVAARMQKIEAATESAKPERIKPRAMREDFRDVYSWTHHPEAARRAFIAATIFGPPKAFESPTTLWDY